MFHPRAPQHTHYLFGSCSQLKLNEFIRVYWILQISENFHQLSWIFHLLCSRLRADIFQIEKQKNSGNFIEETQPTKKKSNEIRLEMFSTNENLLRIPYYLLFLLLSNRMSNSLLWTWTTAMAVNSVNSLKIWQEGNDEIIFFSHCFPFSSFKANAHWHFQNFILELESCVESILEISCPRLTARINFSSISLIQNAHVKHLINF